MDITNIDRQIGTVKETTKTEPSHTPSEPKTEKPTKLQYLKDYFEKNRLKGLTTIREQLGRDRVAEEVKWARNKEKERVSTWKNSRSLEEYDQLLNGMKASLEYVVDHQQELGSKLFVDIGAGGGQAANQLSSTELGKKLDVQITNIVKPREQAISPKSWDWQVNY